MLRRLALDLLAPALCGGLVTLGFAPFDYWPLTLVGIAGLIGLWWQASARCAAGRGFVFGLACFGTGLYWPYVSIHSFGNAPAALAVVLTALLVVYLALYPMLVGAFAGATKRWPRPVWALLLVPGAWLLAELVRGRIGTGFPWLSLGYSLIDSPISALAPIIGVYGLGCVLVAAAGVLVLLLVGSLLARWLAVVIIALIPIAIWAVPAPGYWTSPVADDSLSAAIVQGNFSQKVKSKPSTLGTTLRRYKQLTQQSDADLVLWPETAIPVPADRVRRYVQSLDDMARGKDQSLLAGTLVSHESSYYNTLLAMGQDRGHYYKRHLVPFGEYFPVPDFVKRWMNGVNMRFGSLAFGPETQQLIHVQGVDIGASICFEDVFPRDIAKALPGAGLLVNVTNDAWFAGTIAPAQHLQIARMRALESGRPMLRAANTGISAIIGYTGRTRQTAPQFQTATLSSPRVVPRRGTTPFVALGNAPFWWASGLLVLFGLIGATLIARQRR